jgi:hypothetical protein
LLRLGHNTKAVVRLKGEIFLYKHATIVAFCTPSNPRLSRIYYA